MVSRMSAPEMYTRLIWGMAALATAALGAVSYTHLDVYKRQLYYHAGLVVIPDHNMAAAVLSSGGVSTYNEMAASRMLSLIHI